MTATVVGLAASQLTLAVLLLSLNLRSAWPWIIKAGAIALTFAVFVAGCLALEGMLGWPIGTSPPASFQLHAAVVQEPDRRNPSPGAIYLWLSPRDAEPAAAAPPRAYALPYSRPLHEQVARAQSRLEDGREVAGEARQVQRRDRAGAGTWQVELFEAPPAVLPSKAED